MGHITGAQICGDGMWKKSTGAISSSWSTRKKRAVNPQLLQGLPIWLWRCHRACPKQTLKGLKRLWQKWKLTIAPNPKKNCKYRRETTQPGKINTNFHQAMTFNVPNYVVYMRAFHVFNAKKWSQHRTHWQHPPRKIHGDHPSAKYVSLTNWDGDTIYKNVVIT